MRCSYASLQVMSLYAARNSFLVIGSRKLLSTVPVACLIAFLAPHVMFVHVAKMNGILFQAGKKQRFDQLRINREHRFTFSVLFNYLWALTYKLPAARPIG